MNFLTRLGPGSSLGRAEFQVESDLGELPLLDPRRAAMQRLPWLTAAATATVLLLTHSPGEPAVGRRSEQRSATAAAAAAAGVDAVATVPGTDHSLV